MHAHALQGSPVSGPVVHPLRVFKPLDLLAPPNITVPLNFAGNIVEDSIAESTTELADAIEQGAASSSNALKAITG